MLAVILAVTVLVGAAIAGWFFWRLASQTKKPPAGGGGELLSKQIQTETLIQSITDGVIVTDTQNKISLFNKAAAAMTEWPADEALGIEAQTILKLLADEKTNAFIDNANHPFCKVIQTRAPIQETVQLVSRGNKKLFISLAISPIIIPKKEELVGSVAVFRDVSREKSEEQQRAEFVSTASHEMRTPVAAIEGYLALALNDKVSQIDARAREYLEKAHSSTQHLGKLFQDLLTSAKAEDGRLTSHPVVTEMGTFVENLAQDLKFSAEKKGLQMEFLTNTISPETGGVVDARGKVIQPLYYVHVDPDRIREVVTNVFDNAVKYTDEGKVSLGITGNDEIVQIRISDTGPGIPAEDLEHLFQKFYRVDNSATRSIGGTGLGLFICKKIVELYHGTIWAESAVGKGSTFYINIPRLSTQRAHQLQEAEKANPAP
jgi:two-component system, OmpR family, sensor histidine kinase VicK